MTDPADPPSPPSPRAVLSSLLGRIAPDVVQSLAEEAAQAATGEEGVVDATVEEYVTWLGTFVPYAIAAVAADDEARVRILESMRTVVPATSVPAVPILARVGLLAIGLRLARDELPAAARSASEAATLLAEFDLFAEVLQSTLAPVVFLV